MREPARRPSVGDRSLGRVSMRGGAGPSGGTGGGRRGGRGIGSGDAERLRAENAVAPQVPDLLPRVAALFRPYRAGLAAVCVLVLLGAAFNVAWPLLTQRAFDHGLFPPSGEVDVPVLVEIVGLMVGAALAAALVGVLQSLLTVRIGTAVTGELRVRLFEHLQRMELGFFTRTKTGVIQSRIQNDVGGVAGVLTTTVQNVVGNTVTVIASVVAMVLLSWPMAVAALLLLPVLVIAQRRVGQVRARVATQTQESLSRLTSITQESLSVSGVLLTKSFTRQRAEVQRYTEENREQVALQVRQAMTGQWFFALVQVVLYVIPAVIYLVAAWLLAHGGQLTPGTIIAFTTVLARVSFPMLGLLRVALDLQTSRALFARIFDYLDLRPAIVDAPDARDVNRARLGEVAFEDVGFRYPGAGESTTPTLEGVTFSLAPGTFAAVVGPSGAGKTTLGYLLPRLYDATSGVVRFAGDDVRDLRQEDLLCYIGIVSQETYLFHASIAENLRYARPDATDAELEAASRAANLHETVASFPEGYDTVVGERGYRLSGGEKQRVAIARVLLKDPPVLILDEATSALDTVSERLVQRALDDAARGRTTLAIAHRLSTVVHADVILVVDRGRVVERGTHAELLALGGVYAGLVAEQVKTAEVSAPLTRGRGLL